VYALVRNLGTRVEVTREVATLAASLVIAEAFYRFHSFTLECVAFLATWMALGGLAELGGRLIRGAGGSERGV
jgi:hypothetical protein